SRIPSITRISASSTQLRTPTSCASRARCWQRTSTVPCSSWPYPSGEPFRSGTAAAQQRLLALLPRYGYVGALLAPPAPSTLQYARAPYQLPRVRVDPGESLAAFAT